MPIIPTHGRSRSIIESPNVKEHSIDVQFQSLHEHEFNCGCSLEGCLFVSCCAWRMSGPALAIRGLELSLVRGFFFSSAVTSPLPTTTPRFPEHSTSTTLKCSKTTGPCCIPYRRRQRPARYQARKDAPVGFMEGGHRSASPGFEQHSGAESQVVPSRYPNNSLAVPQSKIVVSRG